MDFEKPLIVNHALVHGGLLGGGRSTEVIGTKRRDNRERLKKSIVMVKGAKRPKQ